MDKLSFNISIHAPKQKVWKVLWDDATYRQWTSVFTEGSHAESDWKEGSKILFIDGNNDGMYSRIEKSVENEQMVFLHLGELIKGEEKPADESWQGATESYFLTENNGVTELVAELAAIGEHQEYFKNTFPKALEKVKELAEIGPHP